MQRSWQHPWQHAALRVGGMMPTKLVLSIAEAAEVLGVSDDLMPHASARATCWERSSATSSAAGADRAIVRTERRFFGLGSR
jgi:hypothetical protein